jgi:hypothetical protein
VDLGTVLLREGQVGEDVLLGLVEEGGELRQLDADLIRDLAPLRLGGAGVVLGEGGRDEGRDDAPAAAAGMGERIAHEVHPAALPAGAEHARDGRLDALMGVRDHQLDAGEATPLELAQELDPEERGVSAGAHRTCAGPERDQRAPELNAAAERPGLNWAACAPPLFARWPKRGLSGATRSARPGQATMP